MRVSVDDLVQTSRSRRLGIKESKRLVLIQNNVRVRIEALMPGEKRWVIGQRVTEARVLASSLTAPTSRGSLRPFAHQSAMFVWGLAPVDYSPPITRRGPEGAHRVLWLPAVKVEDVTISRTMLRTSRVDVGYREATMACEGVYADRLGYVAVDLARCLPPRIAIAEVSKILQTEVAFDKHDALSSRRREARAKARLLEVNDQMPSPFGKCKAREILQLADAGAESPGEAMLKWMVHSALRQGPHACLQVRTQYRLSDGWNTYFIDISLPEKRVAIEFDGKAKLVVGGSVANERTGAVDYDALLQKQWEREDNIRAAGWQVVRIKSTDLRNPSVGMARLVSRLRSAGIKAAVPGSW